MRIAFITSTPLNVGEGSGTFRGIYRLARAVRALGVDVVLMAPESRFPIHTIERIWFNETLQYRDLGDCDVTVGFDLDGYRLPRRLGCLHVASIKGVIADEVRYEHGVTRWTMSLQSICESIHVHRADLVMTTSHYAAGRIEESYRIRHVSSIVPELIDVRRWKRVLDVHPPSRDAARFRVLCVCRLFRRKRVDLLLEAAAGLRSRIPELEIRIVGDGPEAGRLRSRWTEMELAGTVRWLGKIGEGDLAAEYRGADLFCLPSVQEGFGIVFLEAMAAGLPIVAARAAAIPEVVPHAELVACDDAGALAAGIERLYRAPELRSRMCAEGLLRVAQYDSPAVARRFLDEIDKAR